MINSLLKSYASDIHVSKLFRGAAGSLVVTIIGNILGFVTSVVIARALKAEEFGVYVYVLTWINVLALTSQLGFAPAVLRFVSSSVAKFEWGLAKGILKYTLLVSFASSVLVGIIAAIVAWLFKARLGEENLNAFLIALPLVTLITVAALRAASLRSLKHVVLGLLPESIIRPTLLAIVVVILALTASDKLTAADALLANIGVTAVVFVFGSFMLVSVLPVKVKQARAEYSTAVWWRTSLPMFFSTGMNQILAQADIILVGIFLGATEAGFYSVASRLAAFTNLGKQAADSITAPMISELYATNQLGQLSRIVTLAARGVTLFTACAAVGLALLGKPILMVFGSQFEPGYFPLVILLVGYLFKASFASAGFLLSMTGHQDQSAIINGLSALLNIALNIILIPTYGLLGAALASAITSAIWSVTLAIFARRLIGINPTAFAKLSG